MSIAQRLWRVADTLHENSAKSLSGDIDHKIIDAQIKEVCMLLQEAEQPLGELFGDQETAQILLRTVQTTLRRELFLNYLLAPQVEQQLKSNSDDAVTHILGIFGAASGDILDRCLRRIKVLAELLGHLDGSLPDPLESIEYFYEFFVPLMGETIKQERCMRDHEAMKPAKEAPDA